MDRFKKINVTSKINICNKNKLVPYQQCVRSSSFRQLLAGSVPLQLYLSKRPNNDCIALVWWSLVNLAYSCLYRVTDTDPQRIAEYSSCSRVSCCCYSLTWQNALPSLFHSQNFRVVTERWNHFTFVNKRQRRDKYCSSLRFTSGRVGDHRDIIILFRQIQTKLRMFYTNLAYVC